MDSSQIVPEWLEEALSLEEIGRIEQAVKDAEAKTSAEIVPMIVHRSTLKATGDRILFWISFGFFGVGGAFAFALLGGLDEALLERMLASAGMWPTPTIHLILATFAEVLVAAVAVFFAWMVSTFLSRSDGMHRLVFPAGDLKLEAEHRAQAEFFASDLRSTTGKTGVLLFVSMLEHRAVILADEAIVAKFDPATWTTTLSNLLAAIKNGEMGKGYIVAIESIGKQLAVHFPLAKDDRNELTNRLRISE
jgi:putative membrane protein